MQMLGEDEETIRYDISEKEGMEGVGGGCGDGGLCGTTGWAGAWIEVELGALADGARDGNAMGGRRSHPVSYGRGGWVKGKGSS
jgi:hypothetical protein